MSARAVAVAVAVLLVSGAAAAGPQFEPLPVECDPDTTSFLTSSYVDSAGGDFISDAFAPCQTPEFWNGLGSFDDDPPFTYVEDATVRSDGTSVTVRVAIALGHPEDAFASLETYAAAEGLFHVPPGPGKIQAKLGFEVSRGGAIALSAGGWARVEGPGVDRFFDLDSLPDGLHEHDELLETGATYEVMLSWRAELAEPGDGSVAARFFVLAPEPAPPLLAGTGAAVLAAVALGRARRR